jgi:hypothetical protein
MAILEPRSESKKSNRGDRPPSRAGCRAYCPGTNNTPLRCRTRVRGARRLLSPPFNDARQDAGVDRAQRTRGVLPYDAGFGPHASRQSTRAQPDILVLKTRVVSLRMQHFRRGSRRPLTATDSRMTMIAHLPAVPAAVRHDGCKRWGCVRPRCGASRTQSDDKTERHAAIAVILRRAACRSHAISEEDQNRSL